MKKRETGGRIMEGLGAFKAGRRGLEGVGNRKVRVVKKKRQCTKKIKVRKGERKEGKERIGAKKGGMGSGKGMYELLEEEKGWLEERE